MAEKKEIGLKVIFVQFQEWYHYLISKRLILALYIGVGAVIGCAYALFKTPVYTAVSTFVLEDNGKPGSLGQYSNLASMVGIDIGGNTTNGIFQGDNIMELYKSRAMIVKTLLSSASFNGKRQLLIERYLAIYPLKGSWGKPLQLEKLDFSQTEKPTILKDSVLTEVVKKINEKQLVVAKPDKKLSIIRVAYTSKDELFAKAFNDLIVKNVNDFYIQTKTKKSANNVAVLQHQVDSVRYALDNAITGMAVAIDANPNANPARQVLRVPSQKRQVDAEANKAILTQLVANLELAKVTLMQETPLIQLIDQPIFPLDRTRFPILKFILLGSIAFLILGIGLLLTRRLYQGIMQ